MNTLEHFGTVCYNLLRRQERVVREASSFLSQQVEIVEQNQMVKKRYHRHVDGKETLPSPKDS